MKRSWEALRAGNFDLLVLGGGITGAGVALDATLRGLRVALIDKGDFGSGTSSVSSKLVHGGVRYLEHAQFALVHEALRERKRLLHNAPHLVWPLRFVLPFYQGARVPSWQWRAALTLYDVLAGWGNIKRSRPLSQTRIRRECPWLTDSGLKGGVEYHDAQMEDARLCLTVIRTAAREGACVANYVRAEGFELREGRIVGVRARDEITGAEAHVRARIVLNATGPWVDDVRRLAGEDAEPCLQTTKGTHLVVPDQRLQAGLLLLHPDDGRVFFVLPWLGKTLIGTTDTFEAEGPDRLRVTPDDVAYLLNGFNGYSDRPLTDKDLISTFAGLRPLLRARKGDPSARSREFGIFHSPSGLISVAGGKYTTYRSMAEKTTDEIARRLGHRAWCRTRDFPLDGTPEGSWPEFVAGETTLLSRRFVLSKLAAEHLVRRYGTRAREVCAYIGNEEDREAIVEGEPDMRFELRYQREQEMALRPEDSLLRRTRLGLLSPWSLEVFASRGFIR